MKTLFTFEIHSLMDIVTNSSSELFILEADSKTMVEAMLSTVYPNYLAEYHPVQSLHDLNKNDLETYLYYKGLYNLNHYSRMASPESKYPMIHGIPQSELYENWSERHKDSWFYPKLNNDVLGKLKDALDPEGKIWFLFSIGSNPDWDKQEELSLIATRYHMG